MSSSRSSGIGLAGSAGSAVTRSSTRRSARFSRRRRSIARRRAVSAIQAAGLGGTPSRGQRSSATTKASWTASSARSRSPNARARAATAWPDSRRNRRSIAAPGALSRLPRAALGGDVGLLGAHRLVVHDRPHLDRSVLRARDAGGPADRLVEVPAVEQVVAAELLARLGERPVGGDRLVIADANGRGRARRLQALAAEQHAGLLGSLAE